MAKISTYPHASSPQLSDMLIGSEVGDGNATKNFLISDIIGLANLDQYVPYTGATQDVDLGAYNLTANSATIADGLTILSGLSEFNGPAQFIGSVTIDSQLIDGLGSPGAANSVLTSNGSGTIWSDSLDLVDVKTSGEMWIDGILKDNLNNPGTSGQVLKSTGTGIVWDDEDNSVLFGVFYDDTDQVCTTGTPAAMKFGTTVSSDGVSVVADGLGNSTEIRVTQRGFYNIQFSAQIERASGGSAEKVDIWFRLNGADLPWSNTQITLQANASYHVASWNIISEINIGDSFQIMWHQTGGSIRLTSDPAQTSPVRPATPSTILTVTKVS